MRKDEGNTFQKFFDEKVNDFVIRAVFFTDEMRKFRKLAPMADQLIRSATSIGANVHEARGCSSRKEYRRYFEHAVKSAHETIYWLHLVAKLETRLAMRASRMEKESTEIQKILATSIRSLSAEGKKL